jgi:hypothetical protein
MCEAIGVSYEVIECAIKPENIYCGNLTVVPELYFVPDLLALENHPKFHDLVFPILTSEQMFVYLKEIFVIKDEKSLVCLTECRLADHAVCVLMKLLAFAVQSNNQIMIENCNCFSLCDHINHAGIGKLLDYFDSLFVNEPRRCCLNWCLQILHFLNWPGRQSGIQGKVHLRQTSQDFTSYWCHSIPHVSENRGLRRRRAF